MSDENDNAPVFLPSSYSTVITEGEDSRGKSIVTVTATDRDDGKNKEIVYSITHGNIADTFTINNITVRGLLVYYTSHLDCLIKSVHLHHISIDTIILDHHHQPSSSTIIINHHHQPSSSTVIINRHHQPSSSIIIINRHHQPSSSTIIINHHHQSSSSTVIINRHPRPSSSTIIINHG